MSTNKVLKLGLALFAATLTMAACTKKSTTATSPRELNLAIWGNYLRPELQAQFEKETGIKLNISNYSSNEELLAKVQAGASGIDMAVPSDYMVEIMAKSNLLEPLDMAQIPNKTQVSDDLLNPAYDPGNKFSLPYAWSTAGLAINTDLYSKPITTWKQFFESKDLKGKISMLDDVREVMGAALKANGSSVNTTDANELKKAKATLISAKANIKMFRSDTIEALANKEVAIAHAYSTDALQAMAENPKIVYVVPEDGGTKAVDTMVILKGAKHPKEAHELVNFLLKPESNLEFVKAVRGGPVLKTTKEKLPTDLQNNKALFPPESQLAKLERIQDLGDKTEVYDQIWTEVKSH